ncbi:hypothetical protein RIF29_09947 [Crotalaria pallida]|uniref:Uncharacterized protein n=1 Tax=Crotalaria pallida TaxID=3830 RepID=A0AAN9FUS8_CROPI
MSIRSNSLHHSPPSIPPILLSSSTNTPFSTLKCNSRGFSNPNKFRILAKSADSDAQQQTTLNQSTPSASLLSILCPLLKLFSRGDPSQQRNFILRQQHLPWLACQALPEDQTP